jgi:hypothetical protein
MTPAGHYPDPPLLRHNRRVFCPDLRLEKPSPMREFLLQYRGWEIQIMDRTGGTEQFVAGDPTQTCTFLLLDVKNDHSIVARSTSNDRRPSSTLSPLFEGLFLPTTENHTRSSCRRCAGTGTGRRLDFVGSNAYISRVELCR